MFTYVCLGTNDPARARRFYDAVLGVLGHARCEVAGPGWEGWNGWGRYEPSGPGELAIWLCPPFDGGTATVGNGTMVAFAARSWGEVDGFHAAALTHGGSCDGPPGLRPQYGADFYGAYVRDPDGNKLAAVCRGFTAPPRT